MSTADRDDIGRRSFVKELAALGVGAWAAGACARAATVGPGSASLATAGQRPSIDRAGLQLFTVRDRMQADFDATLAQVAQAGYREVEFFAYNGRTPEQVKAVLDRVGLRAPSTHFALRPGPDLEKQLAGYQLMGHVFAAAGGPGGPGRGPGGGPPGGGAPGA